MVKGCKSACSTYEFADQVRQVLTGLMGFMMYKLALVGCSAVPTPPHQHATEEERLI